MLQIAFHLLQNFSSRSLHPREAFQTRVKRRGGGGEERKRARRRRGRGRERKEREKGGKGRGDPGGAKWELGLDTLPGGMGHWIPGSTAWLGREWRGRRAVSDQLLAPSRRGERPLRGSEMAEAREEPLAFASAGLRPQSPAQPRARGRRRPG